MARGRVLSRKKVEISISVLLALAIVIQGITFLRTSSGPPVEEAEIFAHHPKHPYNSTPNVRKQIQDVTNGTKLLTKKVEERFQPSTRFCMKRPNVLAQIRVANSTKHPKVLCFVMTHSASHATKVKAIRLTWGKRCDKLIIATNGTNRIADAVVMEADASYLGLWEKLNETLQYVWDHFRDDGYDWVFKADDDTFVIMENLKEYLSSQAVQHKHLSGEPLIYGRRYSSPRYRNLANRSVYFRNPINVDFGARFYQKVNKDHPVIYNYGGPGYAMNWAYVDKFLGVMKGPDTVHGTPPEDQAHGVVMAYHDVWPQNTRDELGRERFHPESPTFMYSMTEEQRKLWNDNHQATGGLSIGVECCSAQSISFHHLPPKAIITLDQYLYACRS